MKKRPPRRLRVIVADGNSGQRMLIRSALALDTSVQLVADAANRDELLDLAETLQPDVVVLDFANVGMLEGVLQVSPATRSVIRLDEQLAAQRPDDERVVLAPDLAPAQIVRAIREASRGKALSDRSVAVYPPAD